MFARYQGHVRDYKISSVTVAKWYRLPLGTEQVVSSIPGSDIYPMFIEPMITWVPSGFSGYIWLDTKIVLKKKKKKNHLIIYLCIMLLPHPCFLTQSTSKLILTSNQSNQFQHRLFQTGLLTKFMVVFWTILLLIGQARVLKSS